jgi:hypothetical protein
LSFLRARIRNARTLADIFEEAIDLEGDVVREGDVFEDILFEDLGFGDIAVEHSNGKRK